MLIPAGIPELAKESTSSDVKSGRRKRSFSYDEGHGRRGKKCSAFSTNSANLADIALFTIATKPSQKNKALILEVLALLNVSDNEAY